jgi:hypothetical protein
MPPQHPVQDPITVTRVLPWALLAVLLIAGIVLYFRHGAEVTPIVGAVR